MNSKKPQNFAPGSWSHLADRTFKDYLLRQHLSLWHPISTAPNNHDLELQVLDGESSVVLPFPCRRTNAGEWINARHPPNEMASLAKSERAQATVQRRTRFSSPQRTALERYMNDAGAKASIGQRAVHELKEFLIIATYFLVCFTALAYLKAAIFEAEGIVFAPFGFAAVKALICAKFLSIGYVFHLGERYRKQALI